MADLKFILEGNGRISGRSGIQVKGEDAGLLSEAVKGELIPLKIAIFFPSDFLDAFRS